MSAYTNNSCVYIWFWPSTYCSGGGQVKASLVSLRWATLWLSLLFFYLFLFLFVFIRRYQRFITDYLKKKIQKKRYKEKKMLRYIKYVGKKCGGEGLRECIEILIVKKKQNKKNTFIGLILIVWFWELYIKTWLFFIHLTLHINIFMSTIFILCIYCHVVVHVIDWLKMNYSIFFLLWNEVHRIRNLEGAIPWIFSLYVTPLVAYIAPYPVTFFHQLLPDFCFVCCCA